MPLTDKLTAVANAIRLKGGTTAGLTLNDMPTAIANIQTGSSDVPFKYGGMNAVKVSEFDKSWTLTDTSFIIGTSASTSSTSILGTSANYYTSTSGSPTVAYGNSDIVVVQKGVAIPTHSANATNKALQIAFAVEHVAYFSKRKTSDTSSNTTRQAYVVSAQMNKYYNTSGTITRAVTNYGFYLSPSTPSVYSATAASTYVRCGTPTLYYRASSTYESTTNIKEVTACDFKWHLEVYKLDSRSTVCAALNDDLDSIIINGL